MAATIPTTPQAEMTIRISDMSIVSDIRRLLSHVNGIEAIKVKMTKSEVELSLEEAQVCVSKPLSCAIGGGNATDLISRIIATFIALLRSSGRMAAVGFSAYIHFNQ